jgi:hypothetical protein
MSQELSKLFLRTICTLETSCHHHRALSLCTAFQTSHFSQSHPNGAFVDDVFLCALFASANFDAQSLQARVNINNLSRGESVDMEKENEENGFGSNIGTIVADHVRTGVLSAASPT